MSFATFDLPGSGSRLRRRIETAARRARADSADALPADRCARAGILAAIELAGARLRAGASQEEAAAAAGMGLTAFKRLFRQATGSSWAAYLAKRRMREAKRLLAGGATVEHTAHAVGYRSPTSFSAAFTRAYGSSPSRWRAASRMDVAHVDEGEAL